MSAISHREHASLAPAFLAALALHLGLLALIVLFPSRPSMLPIGGAVPINIVSSDPATDTRPAAQAPLTQTAAAETPTPQAPPTPPAAELAPPAPSKPAAAAMKPAPLPVRPAAAQAPPTKPLNLDALQAAIDRAARAGGARASAAPRGPTRAETAPQPRPDAGQGVSQSALLGLQQLLERLWNPNCDAPGGDAVKLKVIFTIGIDGRVMGGVNIGGLEHAADPVVAAAAVRAKDAVREAEPYPEPYYGQKLVVNFDAREACAKQ
ncbi:MAG: energy transducer TonB [Caulobacterales bacterium]